MKSFKKVINDNSFVRSTNTIFKCVFVCSFVLVMVMIVMGRPIEGSALLKVGIGNGVFLLPTLVSFAVYGVKMCKKVVKTNNIERVNNNVEINHSVSNKPRKEVVMVVDRTRSNSPLVRKRVINRKRGNNSE